MLFAGNNLGLRYGAVLFKRIRYLGGAGLQMRSRDSVDHSLLFLALAKKCLFIATIMGSALFMSQAEAKKKITISI